ncbi:MAG: cytochrome C oxidase subunit IV family protein [Candidatus Acidiferrales bacterium]
MSSEAHASETHEQGSAGLFTTVWVGLLLLTGVEVFLAYLEYMRLHPGVMLSLLVSLSVIKAGLIMSYFMHLKFERFSLVLWLVPAAIFCITMIIIFFLPDSNRLLQMRLMH